MNEALDRASGPTLAEANAILAGALDSARADGLPPVAVVVLDASGHPVALQREDGATMLRVDIALGKAYAAAGMGVASGVLHQRAQDNPVFFNALASSSQGRFIPQAGAVAIRNANGTLIGAVGASGGTGAQDEAICAAGVAAAGLVSA
ncbi:GlcG/HbpS family heme-binding protein [Massilia putida]|uniref:GlcG/HbpS family heme-binding protein n=1 Tax=Massilia putida TaxID=1141883 RepID=UPI0009535E46|nr:heme-binding protein [Massilia putida]